MAKDPLISTRQLQRNLEKEQLHADIDYILKLVRKITAEIEYDANNADLRARLTETRERFILIIERLMKIAFWEIDYLRQGIQMPTISEQMGAMQMIMNLDLALLRAEGLGGIYKHQLDSPEMLQSLLLDTDTKGRITGALKAWGISLTLNASPTEAAQ